MGILERSDKQRTIIKTVGIFLLVGAVLYLFILISTSVSVSGNPGNPLTVTRRLGPLELFSLSREVQTDGLKADVSINKGTLIYWFFWLLAGVTVGYLRSQLITVKSKK
jgi:hypothetical protein